MWLKTITIFFVVFVSFFLLFFLIVSQREFLCCWNTRRRIKLEPCMLCNLTKYNNRTLTESNEDRKNIGYFILLLSVFELAVRNKKVFFLFSFFLFWVLNVLEITIDHKKYDSICFGLVVDHSIHHLCKQVQWRSVPSSGPCENKFGGNITSGGFNLSCDSFILCFHLFSTIRRVVFGWKCTLLHEFCFSFCMEHRNGGFLVWRQHGLPIQRIMECFLCSILFFCMAFCKKSFQEFIGINNQRTTKHNHKKKIYFFPFCWWQHLSSEQKKTFTNEMSLWWVDHHDGM